MEPAVTGVDAADYEADLASLNRRVESHARRRRQATFVRGLLRMVWRRAMQVYVLVCLAVVALGLNAAFPGPGERLAYALADPALILDRPFASCAEAHTNGYYWIHRSSRAYDAAQDPDGDGRACKPRAGEFPDPMWRLRIIQDRLFAPW